MKVKDFLEVMKRAKKWDHNVNYAENPLLYHYSDCCGGMYTCSPYKEQFLRLWKFSSKSTSEQSSKRIYDAFLNFLSNKDFVGCDMARKYLQAGFQKKAIEPEFKRFFENFYFDLASNSGYQNLKKDFLEKQKKFRLKTSK